MGIEGSQSQYADFNSRRQTSNNSDETIPQENNQYLVRLEKINELREMGIDPFPDRFERTHTSMEILYDPANLDQDVSVAGRLMSIRKMGRINFAHIQDGDGRLQIYLKTDDIGEDKLAFFNKYFDLGDIVGVKGKTFITKSGEITVHVDDFSMLAKGLRPMPDKFHGVTDDETRYRERYLELLTNPETKKRFLDRIKIIRGIRGYLDQNGFLEVETPILQPNASGATAEPFKTHHNSLNQDLVLRIAPETYLKRLIVGGFDRVYEIGRTFRNEGVDHSHLQDFTMLEFYASFWNSSQNIKFTEGLVRSLIENVRGSNQTINPTGIDIDLSQEWPIVKYRDVVEEFSGIDIEEYESEDELRTEIKRRGITFEGIDKPGMGNLIDKVYKATTRPHLIQPQFVTEYPFLLSPLARRNDQNANYVDQFQLLINGWEIAKGYSELVDPIDQRQRLTDQAKLKTQGDPEAMSLDEDYLLAMEYGMAPNSGVGIGVDRLTAMITNIENLRETVFFPLLRERNKST